MCVCVCESISKDRQQTSSAYVKGAASACPCLPHCLTFPSLPAPACVGCMNFKCLCQGAAEAEAEAEAVAIVRHWQSGTRHFMQDVPGLNPSIYRAHVLNLTCYSFPPLLSSPHSPGSRAKQSPWPTLTNCRPSLVAFNFHETRRQQLLS